MQEKTDYRILYVIYLLAVVIGLIFFITQPLSYLSSGQTEYTLYAQNIIKGNGFSLDANPPYHVSVYRVPGYSIFLSLLYSCFGVNYNAVVVVQILLNAFVSVMAFYLVKKYFKIKFAYLISFLVAVYPFTTVFVNVMYSETLCIFLFILGVLLFEIARGNRNILCFALSGLVMGLCLLVRPGTALMPFFMSLAYVLIENLKAVRRHLFIFNICVLLVWLPWVVRNYHVSGAFIPLTIEAKEELFWASGSTGKYFENRMDNPEFSRQMDEVTRQVESSGLYGLRRKMLEEDLYLQYALKNIKGHPFIFLFSSLQRIPRMWVTSLSPNNISQGYGFRILGGNKIVFILIQYFLFSCFALAVYGMWLVRKRWKEFIFLALPIFYFCFTHMFILAEARFTLPGRAFLLIFSVIGFLGMFNRKLDFLYG